MVLCQVRLDEKADKIVKHLMIDMNIKTKSETINYIVKEYYNLKKVQK